MQLSDRIGRRMKLQDLHILITVVQAGSMGKAAQRLNTTQPNISRAINELEHALGVRLLDRHRQGINPTEYGRALLDCGVAVFDDLRQGVKNIEFLADPAAGEVRIGCSHFVAASLVPAVVDQLSRRYPRIAFHIMPGTDEALHRDLHERNVDFLVTWGASRFADEQLAFEPLFDDVHVVVAGAQNPWVRRRKIELAELVNEPWVLPSTSSELGTVAKRAFRARGLNPRATVSSSPTEVRIRMLATGRFLTVVPASILRFPTRRVDIKALPVELSTTRVPVGIVTLKNRTLGAVAQLFIQHTRELAKPLANKNRKRNVV
ncbi:MAG TPA: LysR family transcriptional regulator [Burkholderiaceae bacterium]|nr:LysR family transcriptional regulator [Burkholderiaceae bacterium]